MYELKVKDGKTQFLMKVGKDYVRNEMDVKVARNLMNSGVPTDKVFDEYPINIDNKYHFAGTLTCVEKPAPKKRVKR